MIKNITVEINEEYYNPLWFYTIDYDYYQDFVDLHTYELFDIIINKDYNEFVETWNVSPR